MNVTDGDRTIINVKGFSVSTWEAAKRAAAKQGETMGAWLSRAANQLVSLEDGPREFPPANPTANPDAQSGNPSVLTLEVSPPYLYIIGDAAAGTHKIGVSIKPTARMSTLRSERQAVLHLVATYQSPTSRTWQVESQAHAILADKCVQGEWFAVSADEAIAAVEQAVEIVESEPPTGLANWTIKSVPTRVSEAIVVEARRRNWTVSQVVDDIWENWNAKTPPAPEPPSSIADLAMLLHAAGALQRPPREVRALINDLARKARGVPPRPAQRHLLDAPANGAASGQAPEGIGEGEG